MCRLSVGVFLCSISVSRERPMSGWIGQKIGPADEFRERSA